MKKLPLILSVVSFIAVLVLYILYFTGGKSHHASGTNAGQMAGWGTQTLPTTDILYLPLQAADAPLGVLALRPRDPKRLLSPEEVRLVESLAKQVALALEVERLQQTALDAQVAVETEPNEYNKCYLECKKSKMGHLLNIERSAYAEDL